MDCQREVRPGSADNCESPLRPPPRPNAAEGSSGEHAHGNAYRCEVFGGARCAGRSWVADCSTWRMNGTNTRKGHDGTAWRATTWRRLRRSRHALWRAHAGEGSLEAAPTSTRCPDPGSGKEAMLALAGVWKDDPDIDQSCVRLTAVVGGH